MISAGVSWNGKTDVHFFVTKNSKVNSENYIELLGSKLLPDCRRLYPEDDFIFQQDRAPSHTSYATQSFLNSKTPNLMTKDEWPPQSPDCNPMDYSVWESRKENAYRGQREKCTEPELKGKLLESWQEIGIDDVRTCISSWTKRLRAVCKQNGNPMDHLVVSVNNKSRLPVKNFL